MVWLVRCRIPLMLVEGEEVPTEMKLIKVDNGLVRECACLVLLLARCSALTVMSRDA